MWKGRQRNPAERVRQRERRGRGRRGWQGDEQFSSEGTAERLTGQGTGMGKVGSTSGACSHHDCGFSSCRPWTLAWACSGSLGKP